MSIQTACNDETFNHFVFDRFENEGRFFHSSLWQALLTVLFIFVFLKDSCGNQISAQSAKNNTNKEHRKTNTGVYPAGMCLQR